MVLFDYIVVGAGSSGCACAARLLRLLPNAKIALIESGNDYLAPPPAKNKDTGSAAGANANDVNDGATNASTTTSDDYSKPSHFPKTWAGPANKKYRTVPQRALNDRQISIVRAAAVGGCSVVNAMIWMRGFQKDWESYLPMPIGAAGVKNNGDNDDTGIEREFEWLEERIQPVKYEGNILGRKAVEAAASLGYKPAHNDDDSHDWRWESPGTSTTMRIALDQDGRRQDMYRALGADDNRITLLKGMAERLIISTDKKDGDNDNDDEQSKMYASGVVIRMEDGSLESIILQNDEASEVIVSCGAIDSPKLLQLSGIGPKDLLQKLEIPLVHDCPAVGEGLKDHVMNILSFEIPITTLLDPEMFSPNSINASLYDESLDAQLLFTDGGSTAHYLPLSLLEPFSEKAPSLTVYGRAKDAMAYIAACLLLYTLQTMIAYIPSYRVKLESSLGILINVMKPTSVGTVMIRSNDPNDAPLIDTQYLSEEHDLDTLVKATKIAREIVNAEPLSDIVDKEILFGEVDDDERQAIKKRCSPYHHSTGTCSGCLDDQLRLKGIGRLRIADASSLPFHPRVPTNASSMAVGARCASLIAAHLALQQEEGTNGGKEK